MIESLTLPHNMEAERSVLGAILIDNAMFNVAATIIDGRAFFRDAHSRIFERMAHLSECSQPIDLVTLKEELERTAELDAVGGPAYIASLVDGVPRSTNVEYYARIVRAHSHRRQIIRCGLDAVKLAAAGDADPSEIGTEMQREIEHIQLQPAQAAAARQAHLTSTELQKERARRDARRALEAETNSARVTRRPGLRSLAAVLAEPRPPVKFAIEGLLPEGGRAILAAQFKTGKTTFIQNVCRSFADVEPFLGQYAVRRPTGTICVVDDEMQENQGLNWFADSGIVNADRIRIAFLRGSTASFNIMVPEIRDAWVDVFKAHQCETLITDCLKPLLDVAGLNEKDQVGAWLLAYDELLLKAGIKNSILVHHMGHSNDRARGDSRLRDWPDVEWFLDREKPTARANGQAGPEKLDGPRFFRANGRDVSVPEQQLSFDPVTRRLGVVGGSRQESALNTAISLLHDRLGDRTLTKSALEVEGAALGLGRKAIREAIDAGLVSQVFTLEVGTANAKLISRGPSSPVRHSSPLSIRPAGSPFATSYKEGRTGGPPLKLVSSPAVEEITEGDEPNTGGASRVSL